MYYSVKAQGYRLLSHITFGETSYRFKIKYKKYSKKTKRIQKVTKPRIKNIILIDLSEKIFDKAIQKDDIFISVLIVTNKVTAETAKKNYPNKIGKTYYRAIESYNDFVELHDSDYNLRYEEIELYRSLQVKVEKYLQREINDASESLYRYLVALRYWLGVFNECKDISAVISMHQNHGAIWDGIVLAIAKQKNIPTFTQDIELGNSITQINYFRCLNNNTIIDLSTLFPQRAPIDFNSYYHSKHASPLVAHPLAKIDDSSIVDNTSFQLYSKHFKKTLYENTQQYDYWHNLTEEEVKQNRQYIKILKEKYEEIASPIVEGEKFIYFSLHLEPEATIMNRDTLSSQLFAIKLLAESLPDGWKIYVKDHPNQFKLANALFYILRNIFLFRTEQFYRNIIDNKNVRLISLETSSSKLIEKSQAVATICGTAILEAIMVKKPVLIFGSNSTIFNMLKETFTIFSQNDIRQALSSVENGFYPTYSDLSSLSKYLAETNSQDFQLHEFDENYIAKLLQLLLKQKI